MKSGSLFCWNWAATGIAGRRARQLNISMLGRKTGTCCSELSAVLLNVAPTCHLRLAACKQCVLQGSGRRGKRMSGGGCSRVAQALGQPQTGGGMRSRLAAAAHHCMHDLLPRGAIAAGIMPARREQQGRGACVAARVAAAAAVRGRRCSRVQARAPEEVPSPRCGAIPCRNKQRKVQGGRACEASGQSGRGTGPARGSSPCRRSRTL